MVPVAQGPMAAMPRQPGFRETGFTSFAYGVADASSLVVVEPMCQIVGNVAQGGTEGLRHSGW